MLILGLDTTRKSAKVFLLNSKSDDAMVFSHLDENVKHSDGLFLQIEKVLSDNEVKVSDIDAFACVVGPGSFTGIRVGMSTIKGLNKVVDKSIVALNAFEILMPVIDSGIIFLNSTHTSCYYAKISKNQIVETGNIDKSSIVEFAEGEDIVVLKEEQDLIGLEYNKLVVVDQLEPLYEKCIMEKLNTMQYGDFVPYYLQLSQAERNLK